MADPSFGNDISTDLTAETGDGHSPATQKIARLMAVFILPSIFVILVALAGVLFLLQHLKAGHAAAPAPAVAAAPADKDAQIAALQSQLAALQGQLANRQPGAPVAPGAAPVASAPVLAADSAAITQLSARLDRVEANQRALVHAASAAAAAAALQNAAEGGAPFPTELALAQSQLGNPHLFDTVRPYADKGVPSRAALATQFPRIAATANLAAKASTGDKGPLASLRRSLGGLLHISVRRTDTADGTGVDGALARAETRIDSGDLAGGVSYLNTLPAPAQAAIKPWLDKARARVALDAATRQISQTALGALGQTGADPVAGGAL